MEPYAGKVPGINEPTILLAPRATNSLFGLMLYPNRPAFCFAATMLSRNPAIEIKLFTMAKSDSCRIKKTEKNTNTAVEVVFRRNLSVTLRRGKSIKCFPVFMGTEPRISTPSSSQSNSSESTDMV